MAPRKRPVGRTPICDPAYVRRIDPLWVPGPVPSRYWQDKRHRRDYLLWLGERLHFRWMEDWYKLTHRDMQRNYGAGLAAGYWHSSAVEGVTECFPLYDWHEWLFVTAPSGFWHERDNRRRYMQWLGEQLGFRRPEDWYRLTLNDLLNHKGNTLLSCYRNPLSSAVQEYLPDYDWQPWRFNVPPGGFWSVRANRRRYMRWLGERLGYRRPDDWYAVRLEDFVANFGRGCLRYYHQCPALAAMDLFPRHPWHEWKFSKTPGGFWDCAGNRKRYVLWLGGQLGFRQSSDWHRIRKVDFMNHYGAGLLAIRGSYLDLLQECLPEVDWESQWHLSRPTPGSHAPRRRLPGKLRTRRPAHTLALRPEQILRWADAYHERTGQWPTRFSEVVDGASDESWSAIDRALREGHRGLAGGSSLARLLAKRRGARNQRERPRLSIRQIIQWVDEHHRRTGEWPRAHSGPVSGAAHETWSAIESALLQGHRGLPGGSSLPKLLAKHRGVRNKRGLPRLTIARILKWSKQHYRQFGAWPTAHSGRVAGTAWETWGGIDAALRGGHRGLPGGQTLARLLRDHHLM